MDEQQSSGGTVASLILVIALAVAAIAFIGYGVTWHDIRSGFRDWRDGEDRTHAENLDTSSNRYSLASAKKEQPRFLAPGGFVEDKGVRIEIGRLQLTESDDSYGRGVMPMFVSKAPSNAPIILSCLFVDRAGVLLGGGGGQIQPYTGSLMGFQFVSAVPGHVKCKVLK